MIWYTVAAQHGLEAIPLDDPPAPAHTVAVGVVTGSYAPADALRFARFLAATDRGAVLYSAGSYESRTYHVVTAGGAIRDLPQTIPNDFGLPTTANYASLNERGQVSGYVVWQEADRLARRGFLLTPVD